MVLNKEMEGLLFEVKRGAVHDGPGLRTTVFMKGCPLRCPWCHNPEGISPQREVWVFSSRCIGCGSCVEVCPEGAISPAAAGHLVPDRGLCSVCGRCVEACPAGARDIVGFAVSPADLVRELARDRVFFEASGGGVTFSGGEPLLQPEFLMESLRGCREEGLHTALDTCGYAPKKVLLQAGELCDLVLFDIKHLDEARHERALGVPLEPILDNLRALDEAGANLWIRFPLIPGFSDDHSTLERLAMVVRGLRCRPLVCFLPYHRGGAVKYARLGGEYAMGNLPAAEGAVVEELGEQLRAAGLEVRIGG
ncbi:MAG: glycyl-radical enzyme activating protein [Candidatus Bipolaricaulota bacterium]